MNSKNIAKQINVFDKIVNTYYYEDKIWVLLENKSDIVYCEAFPQVDNIEYKVVDDEKKVPATANKLD